jgi:hypothetical protein
MVLLNLLIYRIDPIYPQQNKASKNNCFPESGFKNDV